MSEAHATGPKHPYHLVEPSPWPLLGAFSVGTLFVGGLLYMREVTGWLIPIGAAMVLFTMFLWWRDVVKEATFQKLHTPIATPSFSASLQYAHTTASCLMIPPGGWYNAPITGYLG